METPPRIKTIIIDDEEEGRDVMAHLLSSNPSVEIVATADNAETGIDLIAANKPDLVFLDIQMPRKTGFDVVHELLNLNLHPAIVFVTAFDQFAIQAFKVSAFDFLLKPVDPDELSKTIRRYVAYGSQHEFNARVNHLLNYIQSPDRIRLNTRTGFILIDPKEIVYIHAEGNYSEVFSGNNSVEVVTNNIGSLAELLPDEGFFRTNRSFLINLHYLSKFSRITRTCELIRNQEKFTVPISHEQIRVLEYRVSVL